MRFLITDELIEELRREDPSGKNRVVVNERFVEGARQRDGATVELKLGEMEARTPDSLPVHGKPKVQY